MDDEERRTKLQAGKDALLAFQKKKKTKKKKPKQLIDETDDSIINMTSDAGELTSFDGNLTETHLPFEDKPPNDTFHSTAMTTSFPAPGISSIDSGLVNDIPSVSIAHTHNGTSTTQVSELSQLVSTLQEENQSLQSQLSNLQEQYEGATMNAQVTAHYKTELASLQETLLKTEEELRTRDKEMNELKSTHSIELKQLLHQQEKVRETLLTEQNEKHLAHIKRLTQELSVQHSPPQDDTEKEAERIKQLKNKLSELHEKEKEDILLAHQKEKTLLQNEYETQKQELITSYQQSMETNRQQLESLANEQIKQLHNQYVASLTAINEQKHVTETDLVKMREQTQSLSDQIAVLKREKQNAEKQILQLQENHSRQLQAVKDDSHDLEKRLQDWKTKAASLESRLQQSSANQTENLQTLQEMEERIHTQYKQKISSHHDEILSLKEKLEQAELSREEYTDHYEKLVREKSALIEDLNNELKTTIELHNTTLKEMKDKHLIELQNLEAEHSNQVSVLENSISEKSSSQASLEFAEAHMSKLQQELNAYRNQESDHKTALELLHKEHQETVENLVSQREERIKTLTKDHEISTSQFQDEITSLQAKVVQAEEEKRNLEQTLNQRLQDLQVKLKDDHEKSMDVIKENHAHTLQKMKTDLETHYQQLLHEEIDKIKTQISIEKEAELQQVRDNNVHALQELKESLTATGDQALTDAQTRIINLEQKLDEAESDIRMTRQLQERCQKYETELKACQVNRSLAESGLQEEQRCHLKTQKQLEEIEKKVFDLESTLSETKEKNEQEKSNFEAVFQRKEDELASLSSRNQTLQSRVVELTQELEQERLTSQLRQESAETVKLSELSTVHSQLEDAKQKYSSLLQEWSERENCLQEKVKTTEERLSYRENEWSQQSLEQSTQLEQLEQQLNEQSIQLTSIKEELQQRNAEIEEMKQEGGDMKTQLQVLTDAHSKLKEENVNISDQLRQSINLVEQLQEELKEKDQCREDYLKVCQERDKNDTELQSAQNTLLDQSQTIADLNAQLKAREIAMAEIQKDFEHQLSEAEGKQRLLKKKIQASHRVEDRLSSLLNDRGRLEKSLAGSRQSLIEKLREKDLLEKDLAYHRTELERRLAEKQRLEELLYEKSRYEQELQHQRDQLHVDLECIEKKLNSQEVEFETEQDNWLNHKDNKLMLQEVPDELRVNLQHKYETTST